MTIPGILLIHFGALTVASGCILFAIRLMRNHKKKYDRFKKVRIGDIVKFSVSCGFDDCYISGKVLSVTGPVIEIEADPMNCSNWNKCEDCLEGMRKVNKHYTHVIF